MSKQYKVAIITRTQNRPALLKRAIESVHGQSFKDFIHVIINDAGNSKAVDSLADGLSGAAKQRIKIIHNSESNGMEAASNKAIKSVESKYIAIHDDDDTWHPEFLERMVKLLENNKSKGAVARTNKITEEILEDGSARQLKIESWMPDMKVINLYRQCIDNQMTPITFVYERSVYEEIGYYDETLPVLGDWDFGIRFLQKHDVDFLDPGFALANYHHRKFVKGSSANNSFGKGVEKHRYWSNKLMNRYLRQELDEGRLGVGYIMSKLKYNQSSMAMIAQKVMPGFVANRLKKKIQN